jgi:ribosome-binding protein aMBF1 (putative translation factor)
MIAMVYERGMARTKGSIAFQEALTAATPSKLTQADIARELEVTPAAVNRWIQHQGTPRPEHLAALEKLLGIPMRDWTEVAPEPPPPGGT